MQLLNTNNPYNTEMQRQLASGGGPFPIQGSQVSVADIMIHRPEAFPAATKAML
jgi:hypothetical protein